MEVAGKPLTRSRAGPAWSQKYALMPWRTQLESDIPECRSHPEPRDITQWKSRSRIARYLDLVELTRFQEIQPTSLSGVIASAASESLARWCTEPDIQSGGRTLRRGNRVDDARSDANLVLEAICTAITTDVSFHTNIFNQTSDQFLATRCRHLRRPGASGEINST